MNNAEAKTGEIMPKEGVTTAEDKRLRTLTRGWVTDDKLAILRDQFRDITVSTAKGYKECVKAIAVVRKYRTTLEKSRIAKNGKEQENISARNKEAKRITAVLLEIETPLKKMKLAEDERVAKEKAEKERVEKERVDAITQRMKDMFGQDRIDDLAGKASAYMKARIAVIEAIVVDDTYQEFEGEAARLKQQLIERISNIYVAKRQQEEAGKQLLAEKAKLDAQKQEMAAQAKRLEEQQKEFEKEQDEWYAKRKAEEEAGKEAEAETIQAVEEEPAQAVLAQEPAQDGAGGAEAQEEAQGVQLTGLWPENQGCGQGQGGLSGFEEGSIHTLNGPQVYDEPEDEDIIDCVFEDSPIDSLAAQAIRKSVVESIQVLTGIDEFNDDDLTDLLALAGGMYLDKKFDSPIRYLAGQVRKERN